MFDTSGPKAIGKVTDKPKIACAKSACGGARRTRADALAARDAPLRQRTYVTPHPPPLPPTPWALAAKERKRMRLAAEELAAGLQGELDNRIGCAGEEEEDASEEDHQSWRMKEEEACEAELAYTAHCVKEEVYEAEEEAYEAVYDDGVTEYGVAQLVYEEAKEESDDGLSHEAVYDSDFHDDGDNALPHDGCLPRPSYWKEEEEEREFVAGCKEEEEEEERYDEGDLPLAAAEEQAWGDLEGAFKQEKSGSDEEVSEELELGDEEVLELTAQDIYSNSVVHRIVPRTPNAPTTPIRAVCARERRRYVAT